MSKKHLSVERVAEVSNDLGEGIMWHSATNSIYWLDCPLGKLYAMNLSNRLIRSCDLGCNLYCIRKCNDGTLVGLSKYGMVWINPDNLTVVREQAILDSNTRYRFNDANCDSAGRIWTGTMIDSVQTVQKKSQEPDSTGQLLCIDSDGVSKVVDEGYGCPNTFAWSPDEKIMYCADSISGWIYAYDFDVQKSELTGQREFYKNSCLGIPDGSAVDSEGCLWNARWDGAAVVRITPEGSVDCVVDLPVSRVTDCAFAGTDLRTLYITTASLGLSGVERRQQQTAGDVFAISVSIAGFDKGTYCLNGA